MTARDFDSAYNLGVSFANERNANPAEAQNWHLFEAGDELPEGDFSRLLREFGENDVETAVEHYVVGFNETFHG